MPRPTFYLVVAVFVSTLLAGALAVRPAILTTYAPVQDGYATLKLTVDSTSTRVVVACTSTTASSVSSLDADFDGFNSTKDGTSATVRIAFVAPNSYSCKPTSTISGSPSAALTFSQIPTSPPAPAVTAASGVALVGGLATISLTNIYYDTTTKAVVTCNQIDSSGGSVSQGVAAISNPDSPFDGSTATKGTTPDSSYPPFTSATIKLQLSLNKYYRCTATQTSGGITSAASSSSEVDTVAPPDPPVVATSGFVLLSSGTAAVSVTVAADSTGAQLICVATDSSGTVKVPTGDFGTTTAITAYDNSAAVHASQSTTATFQMGLTAGKNYSCTAKQTTNGKTSVAGSVGYVNTITPAPTVASTGFVLRDSGTGKAPVLVTVHVNATRAVVNCTDGTNAVLNTNADFDGTEAAKSGTTATIQLALLASTTYSCTATQTVGGATSSASAAASVNTVVPVPTVATSGFVLLDGSNNVNISVTVLSSATTAAVTCTEVTRRRQLFAWRRLLVASSATTVTGTTALATITLAGNKNYSCTATQTVGGGPSSASAAVYVNTIAPVPTVSTSGFVLVSGSPANASIVLSVHASSTRAVVTCTPTDNSGDITSTISDYDGVNMIKSGATAMIKIQLSGNKTYTCKATQRVNAVDSSFSASVSISTVPPVPTVVATATTFPAFSGSQAVISVTVHASSTRAVLTCVDAANSSLSFSNTNADYDGSTATLSGTTASIKLSLTMNKNYSCTATQTVNNASSASSAAVMFSTVVPSPTIRSPTTGFAARNSSGYVTFTVGMESSSTSATVTCTSPTGTAIASVDYVKPDAIATMAVAIPLTTAEYSCVARQVHSSGGTSDASTAVYIVTSVSAPTILSPAAGATVPYNGGSTSVVVSQYVGANTAASSATVTCTTSTTGATGTSGTGSRVAPAANATVPLTITALTTYSCTATQSIGTGVSVASDAVSFSTGPPPPTPTPSPSLPPTPTPTPFVAPNNTNGASATPTPTPKPTATAGPTPTPAGNTTAAPTVDAAMTAGVDGPKSPIVVNANVTEYSTSVTTSFDTSSKCADWKNSFNPNKARGEMLRALSANSSSKFDDTMMTVGDAECKDSRRRLLATTGSFPLTIRDQITTSGGTGVSGSALLSTLKTAVSGGGLTVNGAKASGVTAETVKTYTAGTFTYTPPVAAAANVQVDPKTTTIGLDTTASQCSTLLSANSLLAVEQAVFAALYDATGPIDRSMVAVTKMSCSTKTVLEMSVGKGGKYTTTDAFISAISSAVAGKNVKVFGFTLTTASSPNASPTPTGSAPAAAGLAAAALAAALALAATLLQA